MKHAPDTKSKLKNKSSCLQTLWVRWLHPVAGVSFMCLILSCAVAEKHFTKDQPVIWPLDYSTNVGGFQTTVFGKPLPVGGHNKTALSFNGRDDGIVVPVNPLQGWKAFAVEVLFYPSSDGPAAPRLLHLQDEAGNRCTIELRLTRNGQWYLDTFLKNGKTNKGLTLIDSTKLHPCNQWYWAALVYDGKQMKDYVNGVNELKGKVRLEPMQAGQISLGVRLNKVNWFKGLIQEVRFSPAALKSKALQHD